MNFSNRPEPIEIISFFNTRYNAKALSRATNNRGMNDTVKKDLLSYVPLVSFFPQKKKLRPKRSKDLFKAVL